MTWNLDEAQDKLGEVVDLALTAGPQTITRRSDKVVVLSAAEYAELTNHPVGFKEFLMQGVGLDELDLTRDESPGRDVQL